MSDKTFLLLPTGYDNFAKIRTSNRYYVDKTAYLKTVFSEEIPSDGKTEPDSSAVLLFTRPRRLCKNTKSGNQRVFYQQYSEEI